MFWKQDDQIPKRGAMHALAAFFYVFLVAMFMTNVEHYVNNNGTAIVPVAMLLLFVTSAAVMGMPVFGKPVMLYIDGKKQEAVRLVGWTIASLAVITLCVFAFLILTRA